MESRFPAPFLAAMQSRLGPEYSLWTQAMNHQPPTSIRLNPSKISAAGSENIVPWAQSGRYLDHRPIFALDPAWHAGAYYVQEASSMLIEAAIPGSLRDHPIRALDLCAAPGGKSTHLCALIHPYSLIVSNEVIRQRARILEENLVRWGQGNHITTNLDPGSIGTLSAFFDLILVDAPCSGEGMFRKDPAAIQEWSPDHVDLCHARQTRILNEIWPSLAPGGTLIYSTCTWNDLEDEGVINRFVAETGAMIVPPQPDPQWGFREISLSKGSALMALPHQVRGEGFFLVTLQKPGEFTTSSSDRRKSGKLNLAGKKLRSSLSNMVPESWGLFEHHGGLFVFPDLMLSDADYLLGQIPIVSMGVEIGEIKGKDFRPGPDSAFWSSLPDRYPRIDLSLEDSLKFLRRDPVSGIREKGWLLMCHEQIPLGWAKGLGNRLNNYFPQNWRLRMDLPQGPPPPSVISSMRTS